MKLLRISLFVFVITFLFNSCKNDLKLNAPYKEIPTIYAVLNPNESQQIIRINKVFLGEGDANSMAKVADSINYGPGELTVTLERYLNGVQVDVIESKKIRTLKFDEKVIQTDPGAFNTTQRVYYTDEDLKNNKKATGDYVLKVRNNKTGNLFTAKASAIDSVVPFFPPMAGPYYPLEPGKYSPNDPSAYIDYNGNLQQDPKSPYTVRNIANNGKVYNLIMRLHFYEDLGIQGGQNRYVDYPFGNILFKDAQKIPSGEKHIVHTFLGRDLFSSVGLTLSRMNLTDNLVGRKMIKVQFIMYSATQEYVDYRSFSAPSFNISQNKPQYSNFENRAAMGIFTFRARCSVVKEMSASFVNEFAHNSNTCKFKFKRFDDIVPGCK